MRGMCYQGMVLNKAKAVGLLERCGLWMWLGILRMRSSCTGSLIVMLSGRVLDSSESMVVLEVTEIGQRIKLGEGEDKKVDKEEVVMVEL